MKNVFGKSLCFILVNENKINQLITVWYLSSYASSEETDEPVQKHCLARAFTTWEHKVCMYIKEV